MPADQVTFRTTAPTKVPAGEMTMLRLEADRVSPHVRYDDDAGVVFETRGWYEVLLRVDWDPDVAAGTRFAHTRIPDQEPLHSEAIDAVVLSRISGGRQLLRGNSLFGYDRTMRELDVPR